jgi:hypothetical protein
MNDFEIINVLGGVPCVARMLDIKPPSVYEWLMEGKGIPEYRLRELAGQIEIKSQGRFTRKERWPDKYAFYWPELAESQQTQAQAAPETVAPQNATHTSPDRRQTNNPPHPDHERRAPLAAALAGGV